METNTCGDGSTVLQRVALAAPALSAQSEMVPTVHLALSAQSEMVPTVQPVLAAQSEMVPTVPPALSAQSEMVPTVQTAPTPPSLPSFSAPSETLPMVPPARFGPPPCHFFFLASWLRTLKIHSRVTSSFPCAVPPPAEGLGGAGAP
eukprot:CAMPEP_0119125180 /NCGR_PEP_ID=MMETSP1310-20130426/4539_1 /TAXON_ID=464262 /ORGANISM="Genus nov. species nov., Strain RCC2339" /LENGTH=146 /DNA_ID=CAMNT_0007115225 /DNA_START=404 /DNA_END=843 /DNA_ORIENTATION=-